MERIDKQDVSYGLDIFTEEEFEFPTISLAQAIDAQDFNELDKHFATGTDLENVSNDMHAVIYAVWNNKIEALQYIIEKKQLNLNDIKLVNVSATAIHFAAGSDNYEALNYLLSHYNNINITNIYGLTPLHCASRAGHTGIVSLLIEAKARIAAKDQYGATPLHYAAGAGHLGVAGQLIAAGENITFKHFGGMETAYIDIKNHQGESAIFIAVREGHLEMTKFLIEKGAPTYNTNDILILDENA